MVSNILFPFHIWVVILPIDTSHGDGFQVLIRNSPTQVASRIEDGTGFSATGAASSSSSRPPETDAAAVASTGSVGMSNIHATAGSSQGASRFMTALHLFQYQGHEVVMHLVNAQLAQP